MKNSIFFGCSVNDAISHFTLHGWLNDWTRIGVVTLICDEVTFNDLDACSAARRYRVGLMIIIVNVDLFIGLKICVRGLPKRFVIGPYAWSLVYIVVGCLLY